jgi:NAD(P)-dependent dehydrogenase (short-subunit alcohol dehydrogenase family)
VTRTVFITGVLGGVGMAAANAFRAAGWRVAGMDRRAEDGTFEAGQFLHGDLAALESGRRIEEFLAGLGRLDAVVNNAAEQIEKPLIETTDEEWDRVMATNVRSAFTLSRVAYRHLASTAGAIVNVASVHALATSSGLAAYASSKGALVALTRASAIEFAAAGIRVNAILPGAVNTPMFRAGLGRWGSPAEALSTLQRRTPLGRVAEPSEIAEAILFLADGDRSSYITGQTLVADGGALARLSTE